MGRTERTDFTRKPERGSHDRAAADDVLAEALVGHLGFLDATGAPIVLPVAIAPDGDRVLFHGSTGGRLFRELASGAPACLTVTILDGLVLARSAFESSMNYRSLVVLGCCVEVTGDDKWRALRVLTEHLAPRRWEQLRPMTRKEVAATAVLAMPLVEFSVKSRTGGTDEPVEDRSWPVWAGELPVVVGTGIPVPQPDVAPRVAPPVAPRGLGGPGAL